MDLVKGFSKWAYSGRDKKNTSWKVKITSVWCYHSILMVNYLSWFGRELIFWRGFSRVFSRTIHIPDVLYRAHTSITTDVRQK